MDYEDLNDEDIERLKEAGKELRAMGDTLDLTGHVLLKDNNDNYDVEKAKRDFESALELFEKLDISIEEVLEYRRDRQERLRNAADN